MSGFARYCSGLLKAGALALVLALFGLATASAHEGGHHHGAPVQAVEASPASAAVLILSAADQADCHGQAVSAATPSDRPDHAPGCRCHDGCACGCASVCAPHMLTGLPVGAASVPSPAQAARLSPGRGDRLAGLVTPPEPRPPLSI